MRKELYKLGNKKRYRFTAEFVRTGYKSFTKLNEDYLRCSPTFLVRNVKVNSKIVANHLWLNYGIRFLRLGCLQPGDIVSFKARINTYYKGYYLNRTLDYKLSNPSKVEIINSRHPYEPLPIDDNHALIGYIMKENANFYLENGRPYDSFYINAYNEWLNKQNHNI